ncbi:PfkB family carbohydrate kinase [Rubrimonas cliftonensis]|uniref:Ribokinase n=1 Tax=Rubrimonas cliftonensis TaxID=89524 RepID=A0A1H4CDE7_9RHOB|nr:PfkB family carbohydrate kinase [Rubrimonas cliftonensis]SEA58441.1 ribokinase [Rubrimonas cliftonensis]
MAGSPRIEVLVAGALHHDVVVDAPRLPALDETLIGAGVDYRLGGKGANQAVAAARMGAATAMAGRVGADAAGAAMLAALDAAGVDRRRVIRGPGASGMSVAIAAPGGDYAAVVVSGENARFDARDTALPEGLRLLLLQNETSEAASLALARAAACAGAEVLLNAAPWRPLPPALVRDCALIAANRVEAAQMLGTDPDALDPLAAAAALRALGAGAAVVTLGAAGLALAAEDGQPTLKPGFRVAPVSSHGAGDMFMGALAAARARGAAWADAARFGQAAAALFVSTPVAQRAGVDAAAVARFLAAQPSP